MVRRHVSRGGKRRKANASTNERTGLGNHHSSRATPRDDRCRAGYGVVPNAMFFRFACSFSVRATSTSKAPPFPSAAAFFISVST